MGIPNGKAEHHYAATFVISQSGRIIGQLRDDKPGVTSPGQIGAFGGRVNSGEDYLTAAWRELNEETNLGVAKQNLVHILDDEIIFEGKVISRHFYYTVVPDSATESLKVYEGQGWIYIKGPNDPKLVPSFREALKVATQKAKSIAAAKSAVNLL